MILPGPSGGVILRELEVRGASREFFRVLLLEVNFPVLTYHGPSAIIDRVFEFLLAVIDGVLEAVLREQFVRCSLLARSEDASFVSHQSFGLVI